jgi:hypothetical protein
MDKIVLFVVLIYVLVVSGGLIYYSVVEESLTPKVESIREVQIDQGSEDFSPPIE